MDETLYVRADGIEHRDVGEETFLVGKGDQDLFNLNVMGAAIWRLLEEPFSPADAAELLQAAFPTEDSKRIEADVAEVFAKLKDGEFVCNSLDKTK